MIFNFVNFFTFSKNAKLNTNKVIRFVLWWNRVDCTCMKHSIKTAQSHFDFLFCNLNLSSLLCQSQVEYFQSWDQMCHQVTLRALEVLVFSLSLRHGIALLLLQHPHHLQLHTVFHWHRIYLQTHPFKQSKQHSIT